MSIKLRNKDYIWSYIGVILSLLANIIMTPFVMYFLDDNLFGMWGVFTSLGAITILFDFGFSVTFSRNINYCWNGATVLKRNEVEYTYATEPNFYLMKKTMVACRIVFLIISSFALLLLVTIGTIYINYISKPINSNMPIFAWLIYSIAIFLNLYFGYYASFLKGVGDVADANKVVVFAKLIQIVLTIIFLVAGMGLIGTGLAYLAYGTCYYQLSRKYFYKYKKIGFAIKKISSKIPYVEIKEVFVVVWFNAWREGLISISNYLANQASTVICSLYFSLAQTGTYSLAVQLAMAISQVSAAMYSANQPILQSAYITNNKVKMRRTMSLIVFTYVILNIVGLSLAVVIGIPLLRVIKPEITINVSIMIGIGFYQFMLKFRNCYTSYFSCTNRIPYVKSFVIASFLCVVLSFVVVSFLRLGMWGLISAQIVSQSLYNFWAWPYKAHKEMQLSIKETIMIGWEESQKLVKEFIKKGKIK